MEHLPGQDSPSVRSWLTSLVPEWVGEYTWSKTVGDAYAGILVGILLIPQSMAYAILAGLPPIYGLYASLLPLIVYALLGSSRQLAVGTVAIDSLIIVIALSAVAQPETESYVGYALLFAVMVGSIHLLLSVGRMGFLVNLLSKPVITGFISAAAAVIGCSQLGNLMGIELPRTEKIHVLLGQAVSSMQSIHLFSLVLGVAGIIILVGFRLRSKRFPAALVIVSLGVLVTWMLHLEQHGVAIVGQIPTGLPTFSLPSFDVDIAAQLAMPALMLALVQFTNVVSLGKSYAMEYDYSIDPNRELFAIGMANMIGGVFQSYPVSGSFSRTAINADAGAQTPLSNIYTALLVALVLMFFTGVLYFIPIPILAAIIMVAVFGMVKVKEIKKLYRLKPIEGHIAILTFVVTLLFGIQTGILIGIIASVTMVMYRISWPNVAILGNLPGTRSYRDIRLHPEAVEVDGILVLRVDASFFYANADFLKELILKRSELEKKAIHSVIIDASSVNDIDSTALDALFTIDHRLSDRGVTLYLTGTHGRMDRMMQKSGYRAHLGEDRFFLSPYRAVQHIKHIRLRHQSQKNLPDISKIDRSASEESWMN